MANFLEWYVQRTIGQLAEQGRSLRWIARELGLHRATVRRYVRAWRRAKEAGERGGPVAVAVAAEATSGAPAPCTAVTAGAAVAAAPAVTAKCTGQVTVGKRAEPAAAAAEATPAVAAKCTGQVTVGKSAEPAVATAAVTAKCTGQVTIGKSAEPAAAVASKSRCAPYATWISGWVEQRLSAQRIWQDLRAEHGFTGSYESVKRYVRHTAGVAGALPFRRLECEAGAEAQVDFGLGAWVLADGKRRRPHLFRVVLSHSRKGYSQVVWRQTAETFLRVLEAAFRQWGGVPRQLVIDNLKAGVLHADWYDPELNPKLDDFARHYGTVILPTRPKMPRHKGKIERGVGYAQDNALKGRTFASPAAQNEYLQTWEATVADQRLHGTVRRQVAAMFAAERPALGPLPDTLFPCFEEGWRLVGRDGYIDVDRSYYSAPPQLLRRRVLVRWDLRLVRIYLDALRPPLRVHVRVERGERRTHPDDIPAYKRAACERGEYYLLDRLAWVGPAVHTWGRQMLQRRGVAGIRVLVGLLRLSEKHPAATLDDVCRQALNLEVFRLRGLRQLLSTQPVPQQLHLPLQQEHELRRDLAEYARVVQTLSTPTPNLETRP